jgi:predicted RNA-binding Zn ribbon-like protein
MAKKEYQFDLSGGALCLDFANTISRWLSPDRHPDHIVCYEDLLSFAAQTGTVSDAQQRKLMREWREQEAKARAVFRDAIELRELFYRVFSAVALGDTADAEDLGALNRRLAEAAGHRRLVPNGDRMQWAWSDQDDLHCMLWPIVQSAAELLTSDRLHSLRQCAASNCTWLFLDNSRNQSRRWCDMKTCGNREKVRRFYEAQHKH